MKKVFTVSELNSQIKELLEESFDVFWVEGEISNLHRPASGHIYFTLKDATSQMRAVIFRSAAGYRPLARTGMLFDLENGMKLVCRARLTVYPPRGEYQLLVDNVEPLGTGALQKAFEQLKARLQAEGLFDERHKKPLPLFPQRIGVVTSPTGAVIRDILNVTRRRCPSVNIRLAPVRVQNAGAAGDIIEAIADLEAAGDVEVIIIARGGGSLEDLAAFNDEGVARAIFGAHIPIISAVGHETDFTIADFVADLRAPTPSAAAELAVPVRAEMAAYVSALQARLTSCQCRLTERYRERTLHLAGRITSPRRRIGDLRLAVGESVNRMLAAFRQRNALQRQMLTTADLRLHHLSPRSLIDQAREKLARLGEEIKAVETGILEGRGQRLEAALIRLDTLSPLAVLRRGYSITKLLPEGVILKNVDLLAPGARVDVTLASGGFQARVMEIRGSDGEWPGKSLKTH